MSENTKLDDLRRVITENLRVQRGGADPVPYIDVSKVLHDVQARQNHVVFARRGCGKSLLLHHSTQLLSKSSIRAVYLNCEDFKRHSFPNVLIEILDALFAELDKNLTGWFGSKKRSKEVIGQIRAELNDLRQEADRQKEDVTNTKGTETTTSAGAEAHGGKKLSWLAKFGFDKKNKVAVERKYEVTHDKMTQLDLKLPSLKTRIREFFGLSEDVKAVFLQIDDFYHLKRSDQPFVMDYIHRLCKDVPLYFKVATLRHASTLYADKEGQPIGAQERHDYQPINIDYSFTEFRKTAEVNRQILHEFGKLVSLSPDEINAFFKGQGFDRLVMAGGGVPRDFLSLFLEIIGNVRSREGDGRIGKDDVRDLSKSVFEQRIKELKQDSEGDEQDLLIQGIYLFRQFCLDKKTNVFLISEQLMQQREEIKDLIYRLLDYRIIHSASTALTHKSQEGTYQAFVIDIGCYAHLRKLAGRFTELDITSGDAKEKMRSAPILDEASFETLWKKMPKDVIGNLLSDDVEEAA